MRNQEERDSAKTLRITYGKSIIKKGDEMKNKNYIEGIFNYCDRWCEKCTFTSRCLNYQMNDEYFGDLKEKDINNEEFWQRFSKIWLDMMNKIEADLEKMGFDLSQLDDVEVPELNTDDQFLVQIAHKYGTLVTDWFEKPYYTSEKAAQNFELNKSEIKQLIDIIFWYQHFIEVKIRRAFLGIGSHDDTVCYDLNGSAKVALIAIDRSLGAWGHLLKYFPEKEKTILELIYNLQKILSVTEKTFPNARKFIRPGFDNK